MDHNLITPFIMRCAGLKVNETAKIYSKDPTIKDHSIYDPKTEIRICFNLKGIFSCFNMRALTKEEVDYSENYRVIYLSPDAPDWNPMNDVWEDQERDMVDYLGEMLPRHTPTPPNLFDHTDFVNISAANVIAVQVRIVSQP